MNAGDVKSRIWWRFGNFEYKLFNVYIFGSEADFIGVSKSGYVWEIEIKVSRSDFKNDFKKTTSGGVNKHKYLASEKTFKPNRFCFAVPEGMIKVDEVPDYAGLIYVSKSGANIVKYPKFLHKTRHLENPTFLRRMLNKFYFRHMDLSREMELREWEVNYRQHRIKFNY